MKILLFFSIIFIVGCAPGFEPGVFAIDKRFSTQVSRFEQMYDIDVTVSVQMAKLAPPQLGVCYYAGRNNSTVNLVQIDEEYWDRATDIEKEFLIYHELGHCVFGLKHNDAYGKVGNYNSAPLSIMNTYNFGAYPVYVQNTNYYYNQLFQQYKVR